MNGLSMQLFWAAFEFCCISTLLVWRLIPWPELQLLPNICFILFCMVPIRYSLYIHSNVRVILARRFLVCPLLSPNRRKRRWCESLTRSSVTVRVMVFNGFVRNTLKGRWSCCISMNVYALFMRSCQLLACYQLVNDLIMLPHFSNCFIEVGAHWMLAPMFLKYCHETGCVNHCFK